MNIWEWIVGWQSPLPWVTELHISGFHLWCLFQVLFTFLNIFQHCNCNSSTSIFQDCNLLPHSGGRWTEEDNYASPGTNWKCESTLPCFQTVHMWKDFLLKYHFLFIFFHHSYIFCIFCSCRKGRTKSFWSPNCRQSMNRTDLCLLYK